MLILMLMSFYAVQTACAQCDIEHVRSSVKLSIKFVYVLMVFGLVETGLAMGAYDKLSVHNYC